MAITLYSTPSCGYCNLAKDWFRKQNIPFTEHNVASDMKRAEEMVKKSGQMGVPVIDVNGQVIVGFNQVAIERALKR